MCKCVYCVLCRVGVWAFTHTHTHTHTLHTHTLTHTTHMHTPGHSHSDTPHTHKHTHTHTHTEPHKHITHITHTQESQIIQDKRGGWGEGGKEGGTIVEGQSGCGLLALNPLRPKGVAPLFNLEFLTHSFLTAKQLFPKIFTFFSAIFKFEHDCCAKFTSCST